jgi:cytochrome c553
MGSPPLRKIPGITADDMFPMGCVSCHLNFTDKNMDTRLSTLLSRWTEKVEPLLLETAQKAAPSGVTLTGKHPAAQQSLADIPGACLECHKRPSVNAPSLARIVHLTHLNGGDKNHYLTLFQGECTFCHKYNANTGAWSVPSGKEQ